MTGEFGANFNIISKVADPDSLQQGLQRTVRDFPFVLLLPRPQKSYSILKIKGKYYSTSFQLCRIILLQALCRQLPSTFPPQQ